MRFLDFLNLELGANLQHAGADTVVVRGDTILEKPKVRTCQIVSDQHHRHSEPSLRMLKMHWPC